MEKLKDAMQAIADKVESIAYNSAIIFTVGLFIILLYGAGFYVISGYL